MTTNNQSIRVIKASLLFLALAATNAWAEYKPSVSEELTKETITVNANGSSVSVYENITLIETQSGVEDDSQQDIEYNSKTETLQILEAYTLQTDGKKIKVPKDGIRTTGDTASGGSPKFSETRHKVVIYPDVKVGSRLYIKYRNVEHTPRFKGQFSTARFFSPHFVYKDFEINLIVDNKLPVQVDTKGMDGGLVKETKKQKVYHYTFKQDSVLPPEEGQTNITDYAPYFNASSFKDYVSLGQAYQAGAISKTKITPEIQSLADNLTVGITDEKSQVDVLYQWVSKHIRYVAVYLGNGGVVPHSAQSIYSNRYGDCKDHAVLLETLLKAKGIVSSQVLISSGEAFTLPKLAVQTPINHVINYIPSLDVYLDATAQFAPYGTLPMSDMDKPVILTALNRMGHTPAMKAEDNLIATKVDIVINDDGSMIGTSHSYMTGAVGISYRAAQAASADYEDDLLVKYRLKPEGETGLGKITTSDPFNLAKPFEENATFTLDPIANFPGPGAMKIPVGVTQGELTSLGRSKPKDNAKFPIACYSNTMQETYTLTFPASTHIIRIPTDVNYDDAGISYQATYRLTGSKVEVVRRYQSENPNHVCGAARSARKLAFFKVLQRDLKAQVFYD